jgi:hypothetical protein
MPNPIPVNLPNELLQLAEQEANRRQDVNSRRNLMGRNRAPAQREKALQMHKLGALGEAAVASHLNLSEHLFKETSPVRGSSDLPGDIEVKTRSKHYYDLIVQRNERPDKKLVLVTIENNQILIHGWCVAGDVMKEQYWADPARGRPAYFVPKSALKDMASL